MGKRDAIIQVPDAVDTAPGWQRRRSDASKQYFDGDSDPLDPRSTGSGISLTEQSHVASCDINTIMSRYEKQGVVPSGPDGQPFFGDFSNVPDFHTAQNALIQAENSFNQLPAKLRKRFDNDPGELLKFLADKNNRKEAIELGLIIEAPAPVQDGPAPTAAPPAADPAAPQSKS